MIKVDKGTVEMKGTRTLLLSELAITIKAVYTVIEKETGEEYAKELVKMRIEKHSCLKKS